MPGPDSDRQLDALRRQEAGVVLLNLGVLAGIAVVHALFAPSLGSPSGLFLVALFSRFGVLLVELLWLQDRERARGDLLRGYIHASIAVNLAFAFLLSWLGGLPDSHYVALTLVPVVNAAFRYRPLALAAVVAVAGVITVVEVALLPGHGSELSEYFEAASVVILYIVAAVVVSVLSRSLREERNAARDALVELEATRDQLLREERLSAIGRLASALAHEIRNPVALIVSSLALARSARGPETERAELEALLEQEVGRLERLTADFLDFARQRPPALEPTRVEVALGYVAGLAQARLLESGLAIELEVPPELEADIDPFQIHQALLNLLLNAIAAAPAGTAIRLGAASAGGRLRLFVENAGPAIAEVDRERIFEPFFSTRTAGTGLGLAIARNIARAHGGELRLEENQPGRVRFALDLPGRPPRPGEEIADGEYSGR